MRSCSNHIPRYPPFHPLTVWCLLAIIVGSGPIDAQPQSDAPSTRSRPGRYLASFEKIRSPNYGAVNAITRDRRGFIWFGTTKGLCRYDGYTVRTFTIGGSDALDLAEDVTAVMQTDDTTLLLGTAQGVWNFNVRTGRSTPAFRGYEFSTYRINTLARGTEGSLWIGTSSGLFVVARGSLSTQRYTTREGLSENQISVLLPDSSGKVWVGTDGGGLDLLDPRSSGVTHIRAGTSGVGSLWSDQIMSLCLNDDGELWIGTSRGLNILDTATGKMRRATFPDVGQGAVSSILADLSGAGVGERGTMWTVVSEAGLYTWTGGNATLVNPAGDNGRELSTIRALYADPVASTGHRLLVWTGDRHGIGKLLESENPFVNHLRDRGGFELNRGAVLSLCEDRAGVLWVGLWGGGLNGFRRDGEEYRRMYNLENRPGSLPRLPHDDVAMIVEDFEGNLWIATAGGLVRLDPGRMRTTVYRRAEGDTTSLAGDDISRLLVDRSGTLWICTTRGLSRLLPGTPYRFRNFLHEPNDAHPFGFNKVSDVTQDRRGAIWAATYGRGLNRIESDGSVTRFIHRADTGGTRENFVFLIVEDDSGRFWLSTGIGLVAFDPRSGEFNHHPIPEIHNAHIFGIEPDGRGGFWLATGIGLGRYTPKTGAFVRYDARHGLLFEEFFSSFYHASDGALLAGGIDGFTEFHPERIVTTSHPPEVALTRLTLFDRELPVPDSAAGPLRLSHDQNFLSFTFAALDYVNPSANRFAYRMDGVDGKWIDAGTHNYASYTHLDPGEYVFRVKGGSSENAWNEAGTSIAFTIAPPYWRSWWFRIAAGLLIVGSAYGAYRYRLRNLLAVERLRLRIADDLHDDVGSNLSTIAIASRALRNTPDATPALRSKLAEIYDTAVQTSEGMRDVVWFIKPKDDTLGDLLLRMKEAADLQFREIDYIFHSPKTHAVAPMAIEFKRNAYLAFKEIVTNIVKHSGATRVEVGIALPDGRFEMTVADNGKGFDPGGWYTGNGLASLRKRAAALGGSCEFDARPGGGTTVKFSVKLTT